MSSESDRSIHREGCLGQEWVRGALCSHDFGTLSRFKDVVFGSLTIAVRIHNLAAGGYRVRSVKRTYRSGPAISNL